MEDLLEASADLVAPLTKVRRVMVPNTMMVNARCPGTTRSRCVMAVSKDKTSTRDLNLPSSKRIQCARALTSGCPAAMKLLWTSRTISISSRKR